MRKSVFSAHRFYPNHPDAWSPYFTCPKTWTSPFYYLLKCLNFCSISGKQYMPRSDAAFCGVWSGPTLFALVCVQSRRRICVYAVCLGPSVKYIGWIRYAISKDPDQPARPMNLIHPMHYTVPKLPYAESEGLVRMFGYAGHQGSLLHCTAHMYSFSPAKILVCVVLLICICTGCSGLYLRLFFVNKIGKYDTLANELSNFYCLRLCRDKKKCENIKMAGPH